jgi:type VI protein secretion system component VasK
LAYDMWYIDLGIFLAIVGIIIGLVALLATCWIGWTSYQANKSIRRILKQEVRKLIDAQQRKYDEESDRVNQFLTAMLRGRGDAD